MNKKIVWIAGGVSLIIIVVIAVTLGIVLGGFSMEKFESVYNDENKIISDANYFFEKYQTNSWRNNVYKTEIKDFTGVKLVKRVQCDGNATIKINMNVKSGQLKLVMVNRTTNAIYEIANATVNDTVNMQIPSGEYDIKVVGLHSKFNLTLDLTNFTVIGY